MIRIIDGKRYNTKTAELVASHDNGFYCTDFDYVSRDLYRTRNGAFFVHGEGGARSEYARRFGRSYGYGEAITPVGEIFARRFCEHHGDPDTTARLFNVVDA